MKTETFSEELQVNNDTVSIFNELAKNTDALETKKDIDEYLEQAAVNAKEINELLAIESWSEHRIRRYVIAKLLKIADAKFITEDRKVRADIYMTILNQLY